jgi:uncharacterized metal-binding protein YceD (DUF177 family)
MNYLSNYTIQFSGLSEGIHYFDFSADKLFFACFEESDIKEGNVQIQVELEKRSTYLRLNFVLNGEVELTCDRCLEKYNQVIEGNYPMYVKFTDEFTEDTDEVMYLQPGEFEVNVAKLIYEFIVVSIPIRHIHPDDEQGNSLCNPEMLKKLEQYETPEAEEKIDPRWNDLKKLIGNN